MVCMYIYFDFSVVPSVVCFIVYTFIISHSNPEPCIYIYIHIHTHTHTRTHTTQGSTASEAWMCATSTTGGTTCRRGSPRLTGLRAMGCASSGTYMYVICLHVICIYVSLYTHRVRLIYSF